MNKHQRNLQTGFSMIEALVALVVLTIGILGVAGIQINGVRTNFDAYNRSLATSMIRDIVERIHVNQPATQAGDYADFDSDDVDCSAPPDPYCAEQAGVANTATCTSAEMATFDMFIVSCGHLRTDNTRDWGVQNVLPTGRLQLACDDAPCTPTSRYTATVTWTNLDDDGNPGTGTVQIGFLP